MSNDTEIKVVKSDLNNAFHTKDFQVNFTRGNSTYVQQVTKDELMDLTRESIAHMSGAEMKQLRDELHRRIDIEDMSGASA